MRVCAGHAGAPADAESWQPARRSAAGESCSAGQHKLLRLVFFVDAHSLTAALLSPLHPLL